MPETDFSGREPDRASFTEHREEAGAIRAEGQQELAGETVFCDCLGEAKKLVICGAGHVGVALLRMALLLGFDVTVLEDRPYFADGARRAGAKRVICDSFEQGLDAVDSDEDTYFVVMSRGHRYDLVCLEKIVKKTYAYLGMMGSKGRSALVKKICWSRASRRSRWKGFTPPLDWAFTRRRRRKSRSRYWEKSFPSKTGIRRTAASRRSSWSFSGTGRTHGRRYCVPS
ncbi:MAG: XdhC family protein [Anaerosacchariphilus sp.]